MEVKNRTKVSPARVEGKTDLTAAVLFVMPTIDESSSLKGGDYGKFSSD
jgi:hypothetical protein